MCAGTAKCAYPHTICRMVHMESRSGQEYNPAQPLKSCSCRCYLSTDQRKLVIASNLNIITEGRKRGKRGRWENCKRWPLRLGFSCAKAYHKLFPLVPSTIIGHPLHSHIHNRHLIHSFLLPHPSTFSHHDTPSRPHGPHRTHHCPHQRLFYHHRELECLG